MANILVTTFKPQFRAQVGAMIVEIQQQEFGMEITLDEQEDLLNIESFYQKGNGDFWIALFNDQVVGTISLLDIGNSEGALRKMFVKKELRGKDTGVAQALLNKLLDWCAERKTYTIYLGTTEKFKAAHRFYERNGFNLIESYQLPAAFPVMRVDSIFYKKELLK